MSKQKADQVEFIKEGEGFADITLSRPAQIAGASITVIRMREPNVADIERFQDSKDGDSTREINTFANLCEVAPEDIRKLPLRSYARLQAAFALFTN